MKLGVMFSRFALLCCAVGKQGLSKFQQKLAIKLIDGCYDKMISASKFQ